ncbi:MAG: hypothetical protein M1812_006524 [Candelaria pacifica]|nr:MAG: hypothetical protein M1812_006524 [Candelaria pacifica]
MLSSEDLPERRIAPTNYYLTSVRLCEPSPPQSVLSLPICIPAPSIPPAAKLKAVSPELPIEELARHEVPTRLGKPEGFDLDDRSSRWGNQLYKEWLLMGSLWRRKYAEWPSMPWQLDGAEAERKGWWTRDRPSRRDEEDAESCSTVRPRLPETFDVTDDQNEVDTRDIIEARPEIFQQLDGPKSAKNISLTTIKRPRRADLVAESYSRNSSSILEIDLEGETLRSPSIQQEHNIETIVDQDPAFPQPLPRPPSPVHLLPRKSSPWTSKVNTSPQYGFTQIERNRRKQTSTDSSAEPSKQRRRGREFSSLVDQGWNIISVPRLRREYWRYHILNRTPLWLSGEDDNPETDLLLLDAEPQTIDLEQGSRTSTTIIPPIARKRRKKITRARLKTFRAIRTLSTLLSHTAIKLGQFFVSIPARTTRSWKSFQDNLRRSVHLYWRKNWSGYTIKLYISECWTDSMIFTLLWIFTITQAVLTCLITEFEGWYWFDHEN